MVSRRTRNQAPTYRGVLALLFGRAQNCQFRRFCLREFQAWQARPHSDMSIRLVRLSICYGKITFVALNSHTGKRFFVACLAKDAYSAGIRLCCRGRHSFDWRHNQSVGEQVIGPNPLRTLRNWGIAVVAVFASLMLSPRAAEAACGDYVRVGNGMAQMTHQLPNHSEDMGSSQDGKHRLPGHGTPQQCPGCSDGSFPPQAPAPVVISIDRWAIAAGESRPEMVCRCQMLAEPGDFVIDGFRVSILRPPR